MMKKKLNKLIMDPWGVFRRRLSSTIERLRYMRGQGYDAESYWTARHQKYLFDPRGVGDRYLTIEENLRQLNTGRQLLLELCIKEKVDFASARILDVGCGTGYYAQLFLQQGCKSYLGIDIVDTLFEGLRQQLPGFKFQKLDVSAVTLSGLYDLIIMMDVSQHITEEKRFLFAMENLKSHLAPGGVIIISTIIGKNRKLDFYVVERSLDEFEKIFGEYRFGRSIDFFTNKIFSIRKA